ncbi:hypothetical protein A4X09_0g3431 [Tilletia walkeri]|uniref:Uncharacterized protein n=1 Tax=Tilletia walkeri TaxID=117179 RepID=A0A8X7NBD5_9BASI|nr:hypothetical protein A4X09_0g3431 [Tilletia walkeri]
MTGSTSTDDAPDVINASLVSVDLDDVSTEKLREAIQERDGHLRRISTQLQDLQTAHTDLLQRSAAWKDELEIAKTAVSSSGTNGQSPPIAAPLLPSEAEGSSSSANGPTSTTESALREEITQLRSANSALEDQVRDLRIRSEESRRAIMRLQNEQSDIRAKAKAENRRSLAAVGPGASFSTWNPAALASSMADADEARELRKSKRASLAFGPNAGVARTSYVPTTTTYAHRRTGSGSSTGTSSAAAALSTPGLNIDAGSNPESESEADAPIGSSPSPQPSPAINQNGTSRGSMRMSGGLRGLRLSGIISSGTGASLSAPNLDDDKLPGSRRSSFTPSSQARSPVSEISETAASENGDVGFGSRQRMSYTGARPAAPHRQMSSDSIHSNGTAAGDDNLGLPGTARPFSVSPSPSLHSKMGSPILEEHDGGMRIKDLDDTLDAGSSPQSRFSTLTGLRKGSSSGGTRPALAPAAAAMAAQAELQSEVDRLKRELVKAKNDFEEAEEARSASEECLRALKEFIAKHDGEEDGARRASDAPPPPAKDGGMSRDTPSTPKRTSTLSSGQTAALKGLKLPPLPSSTEPDEERTPGATSSFFSPGGGWTSSSSSTGAGAGTTGTGTGAQGLWNSSNWSARFSNFPQLIRMSTGASGSTASTTGEGPLSPAAVVSAPPPAPSKAPAPARPSSDRDSISAASIPATATTSSSSADGSGTASAPTSSS